jgi:hypothetical protein
MHAIAAREYSPDREPSSGCVVVSGFVHVSVLRNSIHTGENAMNGCPSDAELDAMTVAADEQEAAMNQWMLRNMPGIGVEYYSPPDDDDHDAQIGHVVVYDENDYP